MDPITKSSSYKNLLEKTLEAWEDVRSGTLDKVENIPGENRDFRATPESAQTEFRKILAEFLEEL